MPSTPSIHKRCKSLDYKILISPKKKKNTTRPGGVFFLHNIRSDSKSFDPTAVIRLFLIFLKKCSRHPSHKHIHNDKVTDTSAHDKQMKDFVGAKILMLCIKDRKLQRINDSADGINNTACQKPAKSSFRKAVQNLGKCKHTCPAHTDI